MFNITSKYFHILNNTPPARWVAHITSVLLAYYFCKYYWFQQFSHGNSEDVYDGVLALNYEFYQTSTFSDISINLNISIISMYNININRC